MVLFVDKSFALGYINLHEFKVGNVVCVLQSSDYVFFMEHPKINMNLIFRVETKQFWVAEPYGLRSILIDEFPDELRPILFFYHFFVLMMRFYHIAFQILNDQFKQLNSCLREPILEMIIDFPNILKIVIHGVRIVLIIEQPFQMIFYELQTNEIDCHYYLLIVLVLAWEKCLIDLKEFIWQQLKKIPTEWLLESQFVYYSEIFQDICLIFILPEFLDEDWQILVVFDIQLIEVKQPFVSEILIE